MVLQGKIKIEGTIELLSGLHIGGNENVLEIGGVDNQVVKTNNGTPYIPGSSLKGKLRNMLARAVGSKDVNDDIALLSNKESDIKHIAQLFGVPENDDSGCSGAEARLKVQDCFLLNDGELIEIKYENSIKRMTGEANPRQMERVSSGAKFSLTMILDVYQNEETKSYLNELALAIKLLELDNLGGGGSRGNGKVKFHVLKSIFYKIDGLKIITANDFENELFEFSQTINTAL